MPGTRERMVVSAALLIRERGARATSLDAVLAHSGAPRGSIYHHFPGGREQLLREAVEYAGRYVERRLERGDDPLAALDDLFAEYRDNLVASDYRAGCPVVAVAVEARDDGPDLREDAKDAFERWRHALARGFAEAGVAAPRAGELAVLTIASFEGALILARAYRDLEPLELVRNQTRELVQAELEAKP
jgi:AcrR family transcriptional regulator